MGKTNKEKENCGCESVEYTLFRFLDTFNRDFRKRFESEFRYVYGMDDFIPFAKDFVPLIWSLPLEEVKKVLPMEKDGFAGTYLREWMIKEIKPTKHHPFTWKGSIYDWHGTYATTDVVTAVANNEEDLYKKLLLQYLWYLEGYMQRKSAEAERQFWDIWKRLLFRPEDMPPVPVADADIHRVQDLEDGKVLIKYTKRCQNTKELTLAFSGDSMNNKGKH